MNKRFCFFRIWLVCGFRWVVVVVWRGVEEVEDVYIVGVYYIYLGLRVFGNE